jgi:two-component system, NarL family, response regulator DevR
MVTPAGASKLQRVNVLVLDASAQIRARLRVMIAEAGDVEVLEANDAEAALSVLSATRVDLVVLDVHLTQGSGLELIRRIRQRAPRIVSIVLTNEASEHHQRECLNHGADFFFDKSRHFEHAVAVVRNVAGRLSRRLTSPP